MLENIVLIIII